MSWSTKVVSNDSSYQFLTNKSHSKQTVSQKNQKEEKDCKGGRNFASLPHFLNRVTLNFIITRWLVMFLMLCLQCPFFEYSKHIIYKRLVKLNAKNASLWLFDPKICRGNCNILLQSKRKICKGRNNAYTSKNVEQVRFPFRNKPMKR